MKTKKMILAAAMAAAMVATSVVSVCAGASDTTSESTVFSTLNYDSEVSPAYAYYDPVEFSATTNQHQSGSVRVEDAPAMITYYSCTTGQAVLTIWVNGSYYGKYIIPSSTGATISHIISCSAGDTISYEVAPDANVNCVKTEGSFTIWY